MNSSTNTSNTDNIKILYLTDSSKFSSGGVRQLMYNLQGLKEIGIKTALVCRKNADIADMAKKFCDEIFFADFTSVFKAAKDVANVIKLYQPTVIHSYHNKAHKAAVIAKIISGTKAKLFVNRGVVTKPGNLLYYLNPWVNGFTCNSGECIDVLAKRFVSRKKLFLLHNGIDPDLFTVKPKQDEKCRIVYIGNDAKPKGFDLYEKALSLLPLDEEYEGLAIGLSSEYENGKIRSIGRQRSVQDFLFEGDIFVLSSRANFESFPNVLLEAMACGMSAVCFNVGAVEDIIEDGINGFVIPQENCGLMADKIKYLLDHPDERLKIGKKNRQDVSCRFSYQIKCKRLLEIYCM